MATRDAHGRTQVIRVSLETTGNEVACVREGRETDKRVADLLADQLRMLMGMSEEFEIAIELVCRNSNSHSPHVARLKARTEMHTDLQLRQFPKIELVERT